MTGTCRTLLKEKALAHSWHFLRNPDMEKKKKDRSEQHHVGHPKSQGPPFPVPGVDSKG